MFSPMKKLIFILCIIVPSLSRGDIFKNPTGIFGSVVGSTATSTPAPLFSGFTYRRTITIDHTKVGTNTLTYTDFPVLVSTDGVTLSTSASGGHLANANGYDLIYSTDSTCASKLSVDTETFNNTGSATMNAWVKVPSVSSSTDTTFYICYGSSTINSLQTVPSSAWDSHFKLVWLLGNGVVLSGKDSTANADNGTLTNSPVGGVGKVDGGAILVGASAQHIDEATAANTSVSSVTLSLWVRNNGFANTYNTAAGKIAVLSAYSIYVKSNAKLAMYITDAGLGSSYDGTGNATLSSGSTYYLTLSYDNTIGLVGYVNGIIDGTAAASGTLPTNTATFEVGNDTITPLRPWDGMADGVWLSDIIRGQGFGVTSYNNQNSPSTFLSISAETVGP